MGWIRVGDCPPERCQGRCCKHIASWFPVEPQFQELLEVRGADVEVHGDQMLVAIPQRCQYLTDNNLCALHPSMNPDPALPSRPVVCNDWPTHPSHLMSDLYCGFSFIEDGESSNG